MKKLLYIFFLLCLFKTYSQEEEIVHIYLDKLNTEDVKSSYGEGTIKASFAIFRKDFETKKKRDSVVTAYRNRDKTKLPSGPPIPKSINFLSFEAPEKLLSLEKIDKISLKEFRENELKYLYAETIYIIHPHNDGYLKWKVEMLPTE